MGTIKTEDADALSMQRLQKATDNCNVFGNHSHLSIIAI